MLKLLFAGGLAAIALISSAGSVASPTNGSIARFREVEQTHSSLGDFAGSTETWRVAVLLLHGGKRAGSGVVACVRIAAAVELRQCHATYTLPEGQIELSGLVSMRAHYTLLVEAASGVYAGKEGSAAISQIAVDPRTAFLTFYFA
jgi:hypothetical protein